MSKEGWKTARLEHVLDALIDYRGKTPKKTSQGIPLITAKIVKNGFIREPDEFIAEEDYDMWMMRGFPKIGDVVLTTEAPLGEVAQISNERVALAQRIVTLRGKQEVLDNGFLKYYFKSVVGQERRKEKETGTTVTGIKQSELRLVEVDLPPIDTQRRIAAILSALDGKIELNRQTNATLEAIAQAIFKEWFVDFRFPSAPVGAGSKPALKRSIPVGWRIGQLGEVCEFGYGKGLKSENRIDGKFPVVGSNGIVGFHNEYLVKGPGIVIGRKGTIGEVIWVNNNFFPIDTTFYIKDLLGVTALFFHYFLLKEQDFRKIGSDSAVPGLNRNQAYDNLITIPTKEAIEQFNVIAKSIFASIFNIEQQTVILAQIRDNLLPKLMNGEIDVRERAGLNGAGLEPAPTVNIHGYHER